MFFKKRKIVDKEIDKIRSEIDELGDLCAQAGGFEAWPQPPTAEQRKQQRLGIMLLQLEDGDLEPRYVHRLGKWLLADSQALRYYVDFMNLSAMLRLHYHPEKFENLLIGHLQNT